MALTFNKFNSFSEALGRKVHNLNTDTLMLALTNSAPTASNTALANITEISYTNLSTRTITTTSYTQTAGVAKLIIQPITLTATGAVATWRYIVLYNNTATNKELIGYYDYGSSQTMALGDGFAFNFDVTNGCLSLT